jgi:hypothetical protein
LCLAARFTDAKKAEELVKIRLETDFDGAPASHGEDSKVGTGGLSEERLERKEHFATNNL